MSNVENVLQLIEAEKIKFVDLRFTDAHGREKHLSFPANSVTENFFVEGKVFDGSSIAGWRNINNSDMLLLPDPEATFIDPFCEAATLNIYCDVFDPHTMQAYERDPRSTAKRAEAYLQSTGIADTCYFGPEPEFFIFDDVRWQINMQSALYVIDAEEAAWNSGRRGDRGGHANLGHRPAVKGGYFPVPPVDSSQDLRSTMCGILENLGFTVEAHHHEVATANQNEICTQYSRLLKKADELQVFKYVIHNVAHAYGKTATFMPKPLVGDNGSGMHCHQSLSKDDQNIFAGDEYAGLSETALFYIGGIIRHARAINAFCNSTTNSYKRLVPGFEAPVMLAYSACNRSAAIRIPFATNTKGRRIEIRFPDAACNPYFAFSAMLMAGLDGIEQQIHPGKALDQDLYRLSKEEEKTIPQICHSLEEAMQSLDQDREFLLMGNVFSNELIDSYIGLKQEEICRLKMTTHPVEFEMYYSS